MKLFTDDDQREFYIKDGQLCIKRDGGWRYETVSPSETIKDFERVLKLNQDRLAQTRANTPTNSGTIDARTGIFSIIPRRIQVAESALKILIKHFPQLENEFIRPEKPIETRETF